MSVVSLSQFVQKIWIATVRAREGGSGSVRRRV